MAHRLKIVGFSLVELSVVLVISGLLLGAYFTIFDSSTEKNTIIETEQKLDAIEQAILAFYHKNGYLPCPAPTNSVGAGIGGAASDCQAAAPAGVTDIGSGVQTVRVGSVPVQEINISPRLFTDSWGSQFGYAVIRDLANADINMFNNYQDSGIALRIIDEDGNNINNESAAFIVWSYGRNMHGATNIAGQMPMACSSGNDQENCDGDIVFRDQLVNTAAGSPSYYDDHLRFKTIAQIKQAGDFYGSGGGYKQRLGIWADSHTGLAADIGKGSSGWVNIDFSDELFNSTTGVNVTGSNIFLPEGEYIIKSHVVGCGLGSFFTEHYDGLNIATGTMEYASDAYGSCRTSIATSHQIVGAPGLNMSVRLHSTTTNSTYGLGRSVASGVPYSYRFLEIWEVTR